ncbi:MAG: diguanylate cyclase [Solirubrobacterales bacterium]
MSFRNRLTAFFLLIVALPMVAVAVLVTEVGGESGTGKADARLSSSLDTGVSLYDEELERSRKAARAAARDNELAAALRSPGTRRLRDVARRLRAEQNLAAIALLGPGGRELVRDGSAEPVAEAEVTLRGRSRALGTVRASTITASSFANRVDELTEGEVAVLVEGRPIARTLDLGGENVPISDEASTIELPSDEMRVATVPLSGAEPRLRLALFGPVEGAGFAARPIVAAALAVFFAIALFFIVMLVRSLHGQIAAMLAAARRIGGGDFSREVPVEGKDEMAGLASEFNKMSERLAAQMAELRRQRAELERSIRRIGEAFAHGLDRDALLDIVAETALAACEAESCRIVLAGRRRIEVDAGMADGPLGETLRAAERDALRRGTESEVGEGEIRAVARPLTGIHDPERSLGAMSIAREGPAFDSGQRELFRYLVGQAAVSVENIDLHEVVSEQAITDELTGLSNQRRFRELIGKEAARAERFGHELSLLILDIDDFKQVNDTYGHLQGDEVLRTIGGILLDESRGVDEAARYGGEEFVLALPETGAEGALEAAERVRTRVEAAQVPRVDGPGAIRITASLGVASMPGAARDVRNLIAAADAALYRAKGSGKNRAEQATPSEEPGWAVVAQGPSVERRT